MRRKLLTLLATFLTVTGLATVSVKAQSFLPDDIFSIFNLLGTEGAGAAGFVTSRVSTALFIALGILVLFGVVYALLAALKYIRSEGDPGQIEEAQKAIKAIFFGFAFMIFGIIGIVLVFVFFTADRPDASLYQVCLSAPNSVGCRVCKEEGVPGGDGSNTCSVCNDQYQAYANDPSASINAACIDPLDEINGTDGLPADAADPELTN